MRTKVKVLSNVPEKKIPGKGWTVTESVAQCFINPDVLSRIGCGIADMIYEECHKESWIRKFFRSLDQERKFNLVKEVVDETTGKSN